MLQAPQEPGRYELRYVGGGSEHILAGMPLQIGRADVALSVESPVEAGGVVRVGFQGPNRPEDRIEILSAGPAAEPLSTVDATQGSPVQMPAPRRPGTYRVRYRMSDTGEILAEAPLEVTR